MKIPKRTKPAKLPKVPEKLRQISKMMDTLDALQPQDSMFQFKIRAPYSTGASETHVKWHRSSLK